LYPLSKNDPKAIEEIVNLIIFFQFQNIVRSVSRKALDYYMGANAVTDEVNNII